MEAVKTAEQIRVRILAVEAKLAYVNTELDKERIRPFFERRWRLCQFLDIEKRTYAALLNELKWVLDEE